MAMREAIRETGVYAAMAKIMEPNYWTKSAEKYDIDINMFKLQVSCSLFFYVDEKERLVINSAQISKCQSTGKRSICKPNLQHTHTHTHISFIDFQ